MFDETVEGCCERVIPGIEIPENEPAVAVRGRRYRGFIKTSGPKSYRYIRERFLGVGPQDSACDRALRGLLWRR